MRNFRAQRDYSRKKTATREVKPRILIVCEGARTEPHYFEAFRVSSMDVQIEGTGRNTDSLIEETMKLKQQAINQGEPFDHVWAVFDRDSFPAQNFNRALQLANNNHVNVAYSNEAFEIWYMLHFHYFNTGMSRRDYGQRLSDLLGEQYQKNDRKMYEKLKDRQTTAIANAKRLLESHNPVHRPDQDNPCTKVFELVAFLNQYLDH